MNDENWYNFLTRREGTIFGDLAKKNMDNAMKPTSYPIPPASKPIPKTPESEKSEPSTTPVKRPISFLSIFMFVAVIFGIYLIANLDWSFLLSVLLFVGVLALLIPLVKFFIKVIAFIIKLSFILFIIYILGLILTSVAG